MGYMFVVGKDRSRFQAGVGVSVEPCLVEIEKRLKVVKYDILRWDKGLLAREDRRYFSRAGLDPLILSGRDGKETRIE
jgi:hypothetical protein